MTRQLLERRYWQRVKDSMNRRNKGVAFAFTPATGKHEFIDYYANVPGTIPEKRLFNALADLKVGFYFAYYMGDLPFTENKEKYRPDFVLPDYRIIIEVVGNYWHTREGSYVRDYQRALLLEAAGYKVYTLLEEDLAENALNAIRKIPELSGKVKETGLIVVGKRPMDPRASIAAQRRKWITAQPAKHPRKKLPTYEDFRASGARIKRDVAKDLGHPMFTSNVMDKDLVEEYRQYGLDWKEYMDSLGDFFDTYPQAAELYPEQYAYWVKWRWWWYRYGYTP